MQHPGAGSDVATNIDVPKTKKTKLNSVALVHKQTIPT
jgi:hypothetical protein